jgi:hypothetical protein
MRYIVETYLEVGSVNPASMQNRENPFIWRRRREEGCGATIQSQLNLKGTCEGEQ